ncbi:MAG TPA: aspartate aminotransferase family protein [Eubacteriaceae bacterium]|nr:aspartate aminotransferase family protein [Eubacteriaceae bacterium]
MSTKSIGPQEIIEKKTRYQIPCSYHFYKEPPQIAEGKMQYLFDSTGKRYTDFFAGVSVMNCGHCNPEIIGHTIDQMKRLQHTTTIYLTQPIVDLAEKMSAVLPGDLTRSFFCMSGSEANEGALLAAKLHTNRSEFIYLEGGLHGRTHLTMSLNGIDMWRTAPDIVEGTHRGASFYPDVTDPTQTLESAMDFSLKSISDILEARKNKIAALIVEPIQGNGGILTPHPDYFKRLKALLEKHGVLLIVDEVQTGFARTGKMFAIEHFGVTPDLLTTAKALGNGQPIAAYSATEEVAASFTKPSASTLGGNPVSAITSLAVIDYIQSKDLAENAKNRGEQLKEGLYRLQDKYELIKDVRGLGLMLGAELIEEDKPADGKTDSILETMKEKGFLIGKNGVSRNVLAFQPPLVIDSDDVERLLKALDETFASL